MISALAVSASLLFVNEKSWLHVPGPEDVRLQRVARADREKEWPFTVDEGVLACVFVTGQPTVYFVENVPAEEERTARTVIVSTDPFDLAFGNLGAGELLDRGSDLPTLIREMAPLVQAGQRLCDQPRGAEIGPGEL